MVAQPGYSLPGLLFRLHDDATGEVAEGGVEGKAVFFVAGQHVGYGEKGRRLLVFLTGFGEKLHGSGEGLVGGYQAL